MTEAGKQQAHDLTRQELYDLVWAEPMIRLAQRFGITGAGLAKICQRFDIPYPARGHWARKAAGHKIQQAPLPPVKPGGQDEVRISPSPPRPPARVRSEVTKAGEVITSKAAAVDVPERLTRPHPVIAAWLNKHKEKKEEARRNKAMWPRGLVYPVVEFTDMDHRRHRLLDALFKSLEKHGARVSEGDRTVLTVKVCGESVEIAIREKQKQVRRPLTAEEKAREGWSRTGIRQELKPTGMFVFSIKTWGLGELRQEWLETADAPMEKHLPEIVATLLAAGPILVERRKQEEERKRLEAIESHKRYERQQREKADNNRWRKMVELAGAWRQLEVTREFLSTLQSQGFASDELVDGRQIAEWIVWAEQRLQEASPLRNGVRGVFETVAKVNEWTTW